MVERKGGTEMSRSDGEERHSAQQIPQNLSSDSEDNRRERSDFPLDRSSARLLFSEQTEDELTSSSPSGSVLDLDAS